MLVAQQVSEILFLSENSLPNVCYPGHDLVSGLFDSYKTSNQVR